jgi:hypothetical protein
MSGSLRRGWHTLRLEGSRSGCWLRASFDGAPLLVATGACDLAGRHVMIGATRTAYTPANVAWRDLAIERGTGRCR